ncbi:hypothetical protein G7025_05290 [Pseudomonas lurida]|jgi:hypothetical protein|uniref:hypothetical protein n=1 Tax=Pseudomonas rhodesiae TaxID=76760 RepID=UPI0015E41452|nr:hypothetical protein [Pseudomonas rhodesiae]MBA1292764.1 hypothetical protein [Pseudomonas lurida]MCP1510743.1 hypothetical protein [Pseudomonas rhodesiae]MDF9769557.1 hypothetical protein [Pseudomonas rhodesiae]
MQRSHDPATSFNTRSACTDARQYYCVQSLNGYSNSVLYQVVPAGRDFFHIMEVTSGRIRGFRSGHGKACELAKQLEAMLYDGIVSSPG